MKNRIISGVFFVLTGFFIAFGVQIIAPVCEPMEQNVMRCVYTQKSELGIGLLIILLAVLLLLIPSKAIRSGISIAIGLILLIAIALPTALIGVCGNNMMQCRALSRPLWLSISILAFAGAAWNTIYLLYSEKRKQYEE